MNRNLWFRQYPRTRTYAFFMWSSNPAMASSIDFSSFILNGFCVLVFILRIEPERAGTSVTATKSEEKRDIQTVMTRSWNIIPIMPMSYL